ncbi:hypothetical protein GO755_38465 [Spirosoma sp. HMF4905]|uniref:Uncharacterized protein n=1 Tax=Spirosoma arboris TaxID=2682092 RepID=A0A7K1SQ97_9BACT|nr:hypothetical protein [Spirosoma arboris]MVM35961.1 hypothetical protein [Spirosoma arboris]
MRPFSRLLLATLLSTIIFSSCSRPVAYFQPTARQQFTSTQSIVSVKPTEASASDLIETEPAVAVSPSEPIIQTKQAISQVETYVRNDSKLASNKKLAKRIARVNELLSAPKTQEALATKTTTTKTTLAQRLMLKQVDKKIKNHLSPEKPMAKSVLTIGLIIGIIGLILLLLNVASPLGIIALLVGLVLILVDLIR